MHTRTWTVQIHLYEEEDGKTSAEATLSTERGVGLRHHGTARRRPGDREVPEIGDELAACRALSGLAQDLLEAALADVEQNTPSLR